jgi:hypothetical protein
MSDINIGPIHDNARLELDFVTHPTSTTKMSTAGQFDQSVAKVRIFDLPAVKEIGAAAFAQQLGTLAAALERSAANDEQRAAASSVREAGKSAARGDAEQTAGFLSKAGEWAVTAATKIGTGVAEAALKAALGLSK